MIAFTKGDARGTASQIWDEMTEHFYGKHSSESRILLAEALIEKLEEIISASKEEIKIRENS